MSFIFFGSGWFTQSLLIDAVILGFLFAMVHIFMPFMIYMMKFRKARRDIPSPKGHWLFGHTFLFPRNEEGFYKRADLSKQFPAMFCFDVGPFLAVNLHHPETVKTLLTSHAPKGFAYTRLMILPFGQGLLTSSGNKWSCHRRLLNSTFNFEMLKSYVKVFNEQMPMILNWLEEKSETYEAGNISKEFGILSFNNMTQCIMSQPATEGGKAVSLIHAIKQVPIILAKRLFNPFYWFDSIFYRTDVGLDFKASCHSVHKAVKKIIKDRREILKSAHDCETENIESLDEDGQGFIILKIKEKRIDLLDILLQTKDENGNGLDEKSLVDEVATFFLAGQETTSNALSWTTYMFTLHQDWQEKCRQEVLDVCGVDGDIEWDQIPKLYNLNLCIKETLRLYPVAPIIGRQLDAPMTLTDPYSGESTIIEKGVNVDVNFFALHRHPNIWEDPEAFDPERFTTERSKNRPSFAYLPFSGSYRNCIGQNFALNQIKVVFAQILRKYRLFPSPGSSPVVMDPVITLQPKHGMFIKVEKVRLKNE